MNKINEEEFENFMHKVTEINGIVKKLSSNDKHLQEMGLTEADMYLDHAKSDLCEHIDEENIKLKIKENKTLINKVYEQVKDPNEMSKEVFMKELERDANQRHKDKMIRREKSETVKVQANKAFRRGEYEKALSLYNKAIDFIRDSCVLYTNRALTYMQLKFPEKAIDDCNTALKLNEDSLKAWLYKSKCYYILNNEKERVECIKEAIERNPEDKIKIEEFVNNYLKE